MVISKKGPELFYESRLDVDQPMIGLVDHLAKSASVKGKRQSPYHKENKPDVFRKKVNHGFFFGNQGKKALVR